MQNQQLQQEHPRLHQETIAEPAISAEEQKAPDIATGVVRDCPQQLAGESMEVAVQAETPTQTVELRATVDAAFAIVQRRGNRCRQAWKIFWIAWGVMMTLSVLGMGLHSDLYTLRSTALLLVSVVVMVSMIPILVISSLKTTAAMLQMAQSEKLSIIGSLLEAAEGVNRKLHKEALIALAQLLPRLKATDAHLLSGRQHGLLHRYLLHPYRKANLKYGAAETYTEFVIAALKALEQIGDGDALCTVESLAARHSEHRSSREKRIEQAAQACLLALRSRLEQQEVGLELLRPSRQVTAAGDTLLRPVRDISDTHPEQLLHPSAETNSAASQ